MSFFVKYILPSLPAIRRDAIRERKKTEWDGTPMMDDNEKVNKEKVIVIPLSRVRGMIGERGILHLRVRPGEGDGIVSLSMQGIH